MRTHKSSSNWRKKVADTLRKADTLTVQDVVALILGLSLVAGLLIIAVSSKPPAIHTNKINYDELVTLIKADKTHIVYFYNEDCPTCQAVSKVMCPKAKQQNVTLYSYNVKENPTTDFDIQYTPTVIIYQNGVEINRFVGDPGEQVMDTFLAQVRDNS